MRETGLSVPELEKLLALCDCFGVTMDELTRDDAPTPPESAPAPAPVPDPQPDQRVSRLGVSLCVLGAVCLLVCGLVLLFSPTAAAQLNAASAVTLNGSGVVMLLCVGLMIAGMVMIFRKK